MMIFISAIFDNNKKPFHFCIILFKNFKGNCFFPSETSVTWTFFLFLNENVVHKLSFYQYQESPI